MTILKNDAAIRAATPVVNRARTEARDALNGVFAGQGARAFDTMVEAYTRKTDNPRPSAGVPATR